MAHLTLQEVSERISKNNLLAKNQQTPPTRLEDQPHRPEFYIPRITRRLVALMFSSLAK
jgi:hypothetical protein